jgi:hypothetical protein
MTQYLTQHLIPALIASGLLLTGCGGGGSDGGTADSAGTAAGVDAPVAVPALGDPAGFPVGAAFANVRKQGFFENKTLKQQASPYLDVFEENRQSIPVTTASGTTASATTSVMAGAATVLGQYLFAAIYTISSRLTFDARFNITSYVIDGQTYCEGDGVPNFPEFLTGGESTAQTGNTTTYTCYANASKASVVDVRKTSYRASLNSDDTLRYIVTYRFLDAAGADNGIHHTATYAVSRSGRLTPQTVAAFGTYGALSTASPFLGTYTGHNY